MECRLFHALNAGLIIIRWIYQKRYNKTIFVRSGKWSSDVNKNTSY